MPQDELLKVSNLGPIRLVELFLPGDLDSTEFDRLNDGLVDVFTPGEEDDQQGGRWVIDLTHVAYLGSALRYDVESAPGQVLQADIRDPWHHEPLSIGREVAITFPASVTLAVADDA